MKEEISQSKEGEAMVEKDIVEDVRKRLIGELRDVLEKSRPDWVNRESCAKLIEDLEEKRPTRIGGPFYSDYLDGVLYDLGMRSHTDRKYKAIWEELEKGEVEE